MKSHNKTLISRIAAAKKTADSTRFKWGTFMELLSTVDGLDDKLKSDPEITKKFLLSAISHFHQENKDLIEINAARTIMNNNSVKVEVLKEILTTNRRMEVLVVWASAKLLLYKKNRTLSTSRIKSSKKNSISLRKN